MDDGGDNVVEHEVAEYAKDGHEDQRVGGNAAHHLAAVFWIRIRILKGRPNLHHR